VSRICSTADCPIDSNTACQISSEPYCGIGSVQNGSIAAFCGARIAGVRSDGVLTIAVVAQKGGAGKTTIATNLAVHAERLGLPTVVLDMDPQATAATWGDRRQGNPPDIIAAQAPRLPGLVEAAEKQGAKLVIIDTAPNADTAALAASQVAGLVLIPCRPSAFDLDAIAASVRLATEIARKPCHVVINAAPPRSAIADEAEASLAAAGVSVCPVRLHQRMDYVSPLAGGQAAVEWAPKGKASAEIAALWTWIAQIAGVTAKQGRSKPAIKRSAKAAVKESSNG